MTNLQKGILFAFVTALVSGASNFFMKIAVVKTGDPLVFTTLKNSLVGLYLLPLIFWQRKNLDFKKVRQNLLGLLVIPVIGGSLAFVLYFTGLMRTPAATASFIHKTLFIWVTFLAVLFLKEKFSYLQLAGFTLLVLGSFLFPGALHFKIDQGELMILMATLAWAVENIIAKQVLKSLPVNLVTGSRMILGSLILILLVIAQHKSNVILTLSPQQWFFIFISSLFLFLYVNFWYRALNLAAASVVTSILVLASPITNLLTSIFITGQFNFSLLANLGILLVGGGLIALASGKKYVYQ